MERLKEIERVEQRVKSAKVKTLERIILRKCYLLVRIQTSRTRESN